MDIIRRIGIGIEWKRLALLLVIFNFHFSIFNLARAQAPGTAPVKISTETQVMHGKKYYVHIVEKGQTVYSISKAYQVQSYDAVTHVDIHFLHPGDTVWIPCRGQFGSVGTEADRQNAPAPKAEEPVAKPAPATSATSAASAAPAKKKAKAEPAPTVMHPTPRPEAKQAPAEAPKLARKVGRTLNVSLMMPLHLDAIGSISTSKFDVEQRGKKSYREFEFIEFYEGIRLALDQLAAQGTSVNLNVIDVSDNNPDVAKNSFATRRAAQSDFVVALLLRDAFAQVASLAKDSGVYIVNPMAVRSEICADNPYVVKIQPSLEGQVAQMLDNMKAERPDGHLYIIHSGTKSEKVVLDELKRQLDIRNDIRYTVFNWSQNAKLSTFIKSTPGCSVLSLYEQGKDKNRVYAGNLLNRLAAFKNTPPVLYTLNDWTREFTDIDFAQLQLLNYHTFYTSWDMTNPVHVEFLKSFRSTYGSEPTSTLAATGYDLMIYLVKGLHTHNTDFWKSPTQTLPELISPLHLGRSGAGLENDQPQLFRMESLRFIPATNN